MSKGLSVRTAAAKAGIAPMYLSLLERDACGPPSDEKLQNLAEVLGEQHVEKLFAKAGRVPPQVVSTILRHPTEWSELIEVAKNLDADHLAGLKVVLRQGAGKSHLAKFIASLSVAEEGSKRKQKSKGRNSVIPKTKPLRPKQGKIALPDV